MNNATGAPPPRRGPRPLLLHLALATLRSDGRNSTGWPPGWPSWNDASQGLHPNPNRNPNRPQPGPAPGTHPAPKGPDAALLAGIAAYRRHSFHRDLPGPPSIWAEGATRLRDFGGAGPGLLLVPSLINRATVLDLMQGHSMARYLAQSGLRVLLLDWGWPEAAERSLDLSALIATRLLPALRHAAQATNGRVILAGYCMGGLLALAAALAAPAHVKALALLATPWDFQATDPAVTEAIWPLLRALEPLMTLSGALPIDAMQYLFSLADPHAVGEKYRAFGRLDQDSTRARLFVAMEDWLNDGVPLAAPVARECLADWYGRNLPGRGAWRVCGRLIDPRALACPTLVAVPMHDRIVPPGSALPLADALQAPVVLKPEAGHVSMVAGARAETLLWRSLREWALSCHHDGIRPDQ